MRTFRGAWRDRAHPERRGVTGQRAKSRFFRSAGCDSQIPPSRAGENGFLRSRDNTSPLVVLALPILSPGACHIAVVANARVPAPGNAELILLAGGKQAKHRPGCHRPFFLEE